jgi:hypothetical protein
MQITTINLDIAKNGFTESMRPRRSSSASNFGAAKYWGSSRRCRVALRSGQWSWSEALGHVEAAHDLGAPRANTKKPRHPHASQASSNLRSEIRL